MSSASTNAAVSPSHREQSSRVTSVAMARGDCSNAAATDASWARNACACGEQDVGGPADASLDAFGPPRRGVAVAPRRARFAAQWHSSAATGYLPVPYASSATCMISRAARIQGALAGDVSMTAIAYPQQARLARASA